MPFIIAPQRGRTVGVSMDGKLLGTIEFVERNGGRGLVLNVDFMPDVRFDLKYQKFVPPEPPRMFGDFEPPLECPYVPYDADNT